MDPVRVNKADLLTKIKANRAAHTQIFEEALVNYRARVMKELESRLNDIRLGADIDTYINLPVPEDHTDDYDRIITMLEMHQDAQIEISENDFAMYVMDQWRWKDAFLLSNSAYSVTAARALRTKVVKKK